MTTSEGKNDTTEDGKQSGCPFCWQKIKCCACLGKNLANSNSVILISIGARAVEQVIVSSICKYLEDINRTKNDQHGYLKNRLSGLVDKLEALDTDNT